MAVVFQNSSEHKVVSGTEIIMSAPEGFSPGDLFIAYVTKDDDPVINIPEGWTLIRAGPDLAETGCYVSIAYRIAEEGDTSWTWTGDSEGYWGVILRYTGHATFKTSTFYIDGSDGISDPDGVWTDDANAFNGSISNYAHTTTPGDPVTNILRGEGTNAIGSGVIVKVEARGYYEFDSQGAAWSDWTTLTPDGEWNWTKIQGLEGDTWTVAAFDIYPSYIFTNIYQDEGIYALGTIYSSFDSEATTYKLYKIEIRVTYGTTATTPIYASGITRGTTTDTPIAPSVSYTDLAEGSLALQVFGADDNDIPYTVPAPLESRFNDSVSTTGGAGGDKAVSGTGSTGTGIFEMAASEQWVAITVVIEAAVAPPPPAGRSFGYIFGLISLLLTKFTLTISEIYSYY